MNYQWYPGHMAKAKRQMIEDIKLVDIVIELIDARIPESSRNPDIEEISQGKPRLILLNKYDLADSVQNNRWIEHFSDNGLRALPIDARKSSEMKNISAYARELCAKKIEKDKKRGIKNRPIRAMVLGIPNVGKSTFINSYAGKAVAKTGNTPGVTKGKQWIRLNSTLELLDTPGILWPKFDNKRTGDNLAMTGSINDNLLNKEELAYQFIIFLNEHYPDVLLERYGVKSTDPSTVIEDIAISRGCLLKGGNPDTEKSSAVLLDDFRSGRLGRITLERIQ